MLELCAKTCVVAGTRRKHKPSSSKIQTNFSYPIYAQQHRRTHVCISYARAHLTAARARNPDPGCACFSGARRPAVGVEAQVSDNDGGRRRGQSLVEHPASRLALLSGSRAKRHRRRPCVFEGVPVRPNDRWMLSTSDARASWMLEIGKVQTAAFCRDLGHWSAHTKRQKCDVLEWRWARTRTYM